jgi:hypothetical protein
VSTYRYSFMACANQLMLFDRVQYKREVLDVETLMTLMRSNRRASCSKMVSLKIPYDPDGINIQRLPFF